MVDWEKRKTVESGFHPHSSPQPGCFCWRGARIDPVFPFVLFREGAGRHILVPALGPEAGAGAVSVITPDLFALVSIFLGKVFVQAASWFSGW